MPERDVLLPEDLVVRLLEYLDDHMDVLDGEDGTPRPNRAMSLYGELERAIGRQLTTEEE